jgi:hypothetical protein
MCRTPGSSEARSPPAGPRRCPPPAANRPRAPTHPPTARPATRSAGRRTATRAGRNYAANPPATSAAHQAVIRLAEQLPGQLTPPARTSGQHHPGQRRPRLEAARRRARLPVVLDARRPEQPRPPCHRRRTLARDRGRGLALQSADICGGEAVSADPPVSTLDLSRPGFGQCPHKPRGDSERVL